MRAHVASAVAAIGMLAFGPAQAKDRSGYQAIAQRDFASAERLLNAERRIFPSRPELMLNLAAVYMKTGRTEQARALYAEVLDRPAVNMDMASGRVVSSHSVAGVALASLRTGPLVAAR